MRLLLILLSTSLFACNSGTSSKETQADTTQTIHTPELQPETKASSNVFDINAIPVSDTPLGAFPYFTLPEGYQNYENNKVVDLDRFYIWVGDHFEQPEGKIFYSRVNAKSGKTYSDLELTRGIDEAITSIGGVKISEAKVPQDSAYNNIPQDHRLKYLSGYGFIGYKPTTAYIIRRADRNIWVQFTPTDDGASVGWAVVETKPITP